MASAISPGNRIYQRRRRVNALMLFISGLTMVFGLFWLAWILITLVHEGFGALTFSLFSQMTPPPGSAGGLLNAIVGSLLMATMATLIGTPIGILAGTYLAEFGRRGWLAPATRFINDILLSAPSIVIGLFIYSVYVAQVKHFAGWGGALALSLIVIPVVVRTTDDMLKLVPDSLREAAVALGAPAWKMIVFVSYRAAQGRHHHRHSARGRAHQRRDRAAAVYRAQQPVLVAEHEPADGESAGRHIPVCDEPLSRLASPGVGRRDPDHAGRAGTQHSGARAVPALNPNPRLSPDFIHE